MINNESTVPSNCYVGRGGIVVPETPIDVSSAHDAYDYMSKLFDVNAQHVTEKRYAKGLDRKTGFAVPILVDGKHQFLHIEKYFRLKFNQKYAVYLVPERPRNQITGLNYEESHSLNWNTVEDNSLLVVSSIRPVTSIDPLQKKEEIIKYGEQRWECYKDGNMCENSSSAESHNNPNYYQAIKAFIDLIK